MEERYMAVLYEKNQLSDNLYSFKRIGVITNGYINLTDEFDELTYYNDGQKITLQSLECPYFVISEEKYCYGYPMLISMLEEMYGKDLSIEEIACRYLDDISPILTIGYYDEEMDSIKILTSNEKVLKEVKDTDDLFREYSISYDSDGDQIISFTKSDLKKISEIIKEKKYEYLDEEINKVIKSINEANDKVYQMFGIKTEKIEEQEEIEENKDLTKTLDELNKLIGLDNIKKEILKLQRYLSFRKKVENNLTLEEPNLHMFFTGNPGTGKTTVARIIGKLYYNMGYIKKDTFAEITPRELIAGYVGQTAIKTDRFIKKNKGGVIFIDEAYVFSSDAQEFADEALVEILKELENHETVFIFAGYKDEMEKFMKINPGLSSRIGYYLEYEDYTEKQLLEIFNKKALKMGFKVEEELKEKILREVRIAKESKNFGNGRYIDKLLEKIILEHASNTENIEDIEKLKTLSKDDLTEDVINSLLFKQKVKKLGF
ncbi:MAG: AAA family ATPase [Bacilli bacterium]|nr:AAA family ATPase [Bacilli bacterium]